MAVIVVEPGYAGALRTSRVRPPSDGEQPAAGGVITRHVSDLPPEEQARYRPLLRSDLEAAIAAGQCVVDVARGFNRTTNQVCALLDRFGLRMRGYMAYDGAGKRARAVQQQQLEAVRSGLTLEAITEAVREHPDGTLAALAEDLGCAPTVLRERLSLLDTTIAEVRGRAIGSDVSDHPTAVPKEDKTAMTTAPAAVPPVAEPSAELLLELVRQNPIADFDSLARALDMRPRELSRYMAAAGVTLKDLRRRATEASAAPEPLADPPTQPRLAVSRHTLAVYLGARPAATFGEIAERFGVSENDLYAALDTLGVTSSEMKKMRAVGQAPAEPAPTAPVEPPAAADPQPAPPVMDPTPAEPELTGTSSAPAEPPAVPSFASREERYAPDRERLLAYLRANPTAGREAISAAIGVKYHSMESWVRTRFGATLAEVHRQVRRELGLPEELPRAGAGFRKEPEPAGQSPAPRAADPVAPATPAAEQGETIPGVVEGTPAGAEGPLPELTEPVVLRASPAATEAGEVQLGGLAALRAELTSSHDPHTGPPTPAADVVAVEGPIQAEAYRLSGEWPLSELADKVAALALLLGARATVRVSLEYRR